MDSAGPLVTATCPCCFQTASTTTPQQIRRPPSHAATFTKRLIARPPQCSAFVRSCAVTEMKKGGTQKPDLNSQEGVAAEIRRPLTVTDGHHHEAENLLRFHTDDVSIPAHIDARTPSRRIVTAACAEVRDDRGERDGSCRALQFARRAGRNALEALVPGGDGLPARQSE